MKLKTIQMASTTVLALLLSTQASAFYLQHCAGAQNIKPLHETGNVVLHIVRGDMGNETETEVERAIDAWSKQNIGQTYLNITWQDASSAVEQKHASVDSWPVSARAEELAEFHFEDNAAHVYYRGVAPNYFDGGASVYGIDEGNGFTQFTYAWVYNITKRPNGTKYACPDHVYTPGEQVLWFEGRDIQIRAYQELGGINSTVVRAPFWGNLSANFGGPGQLKDVNMVVAHEVGHIAGLAHADNAAAGGNFQGWPSLMGASYSNGQTFHPGTSAPAGNIVTSSNTQRTAVPLGDDIRGIRDVYSSTEPLVYDYGVNAFQVPVNWQGIYGVSGGLLLPKQIWTTRYSRLWEDYSGWTPDPLLQPQYQYVDEVNQNNDVHWDETKVGYFPMTLHNFGPLQKSFGGKLYFRKSNGSMSGAWKGAEQIFWANNVPAAGFKVLAPEPHSVIDPRPNSNDTGTYRMYIDALWLPSNDSRDHNNKDVAEPIYTITE